MRRLTTFECDGATLGASLDEAPGRTGLLIVTGGSQTRIGSHRLFERLALALAAEGISCFRFDRRGVGDSECADPGWRGSGPDLAAAAAAFRRECPAVERIAGFGLCDGASALALHGTAAGVGRLILANPWFVETGEDTPAPAAVADHYRRRLLSREGWKKILTGAVSWRKLLRGVLSLVRRRDGSLAAEIAAALRGRDVQLVLCTRDNTAIAARAEWDAKRFDRVRAANPAPVLIDSDSHTFARPGDEPALTAALVAALSRG